MNTKLTVLLIGLSFLAAPALSIAQQGAVEVDNVICPVSGEKVGEMGDIVKAEHNGKVYNLCCSMCKKDFLKNPGKYSKIVEEQAAQDGGLQHSHDHSGH